MKKLSLILAVVMLLAAAAMPVPAAGKSGLLANGQNRVGVPSPAEITGTLYGFPELHRELADDIEAPELTVPFPADYFNVSGEDVSFFTTEGYAFEPSNYYGLKVASANNVGVDNTDAAIGMTIHMYPGDGIDFFDRLNFGSVKVWC